MGGPRRVWASLVLLLAACGGGADGTGSSAAGGSPAGGSPSPSPSPARPAALAGLWSDLVPLGVDASRTVGCTGHLAPDEGRPASHLLQVCDFRPDLQVLQNGETLRIPRTVYACADGETGEASGSGTVSGESFEIELQSGAHLGPGASKTTRARYAGRITGQTLRLDLTRLELFGDRTGRCGFDPPAAHQSALTRLEPGPEWGTPVRLVDRTPALFWTRDPTTTIDAAGNALAVWVQNDLPEPTAIWSRRYVAGEGWSAPARLPTVAMLIDLVNGEGVQLAGAADGRAVAVWQQWGSTGFSETWASRFSPESGWSTAERLNQVEGTRYPRPAINDSGTIVVVWEGSGKGETSGLWETIWATRYTPGAGWTTPVAIDNGDRPGGHPTVALAPDGTAHAVWETFDHVYANRFEPEVGWGRATAIGIHPNHFAELPQVGVDAAGNAVVVWWAEEEWIDGFGYGAVWANRHVAGAGWSGPVRLETRSVFLGDPLESVVELAVAPNGEAFAVWEQSDWEDGIWASRYGPSTGWSSPARLDLTGGTFFARPKVATDGAGNAVAVWWQQDRDWKNVWARRFTKGFGWERPTLLEVADGEAGLPRIALNREGDGLVVWWQCAEPTGGGACVWARPLAGQRAGN
jgi:hypothetical protein